MVQPQTFSAKMSHAQAPVGRKFKQMQEVSVTIVNNGNVNWSMVRPAQRFSLGFL
jgi:hypothetical protein